MQDQSQILQKEIAKLKNIITMQDAEIQSKDATIHSKDTIINSKNNYIEQLEEEIRLQLLARFGKSSEKYFNPNQPSLFNEIESDADIPEDCFEDTITIDSHKKKRGKRKPLPSFLPRKEVLHDLNDTEKYCSIHNQEMKKIGEDRSEQLDIEPEKIKVITHVRPKYSCSCCEGNIKQEPMPKQPIPGSMASSSLLAFIAVSKFVDHLPLYRLENKFSRIHVDLPRSTMARWMIRLSEILTPLYNQLSDELLDGGFIQMDETTIQVLKEEGREAHTKSYMWVRGRTEVHGPPIILFDYFPSRAGAVIKNLLGNYSGILQTDGYKPYETFANGRMITHVGCFAHARRKFWQAFKASKAKKGTYAEQGLKWFKQLYNIEAETKLMSLDEKLKHRKLKMAPVLEGMKKWLDDSIGQVPTTLKTGEAMRYLNDQWPRLEHVLEDASIPLDTNYIEGRIRPFTIGRKNWMFSDTPKGAHASAMIFSIVETAKANDLEPFAYLKEVIAKLPLCNSLDEVSELLPHNMAKKSFH